MLVHPNVQRKAQQEIDLTVGDWLPDFLDIPRLRYLSAVIKESLRWNPVSPMGLPRATSDEDVYMGYYILKDCTVMANRFAMLHDEEVFPNPAVFDPERFLKDGVIRNDILDPEVVPTFDFGRRVCPGSHVALPTLYITAASVLSLFDILSASDAAGKDIHVVPKFPGESVTSEPLPFPCKIIPRQEKNVESLLRDFLGVETI